MKKQKYELIFRMPENIISPNAIELMNKAGYGKINPIFIHGIPNVEIYSSATDLKKAGLEGFKLFSNKKAVNKLISSGEKVVNGFNAFMEKNSSKGLNGYSNKELKKVLIKFKEYWKRFGAVYVYTEFMYFHEIESHLKEWIKKAEKGYIKQKTYCHFY